MLLGMSLRAAALPERSFFRTVAPLRRLIDEVGPVDAVGVEERAAKFTTRSIKKGAKVWGLRAAMSMVSSRSVRYLYVIVIEL